MGGPIVMLMILAAAAYALYAGLTGRRDAFRDEVAFGATFLVLGILGGGLGVILAAARLSERGYGPSALILLLPAWAAWMALVHHFLTAHARR